MLLEISFFIAIISTPSYCTRLPQSVLWQPVSEEYHHKEKDRHNFAWSDWNDEHDSGYIINKDRDQQKDSTVFNHAVKHESERHAQKSAAGAGKHALAAAEKAASKHIDQASSFGKDIKAKTFGFFDYQYKQPEYHVEQFYTDEKHRQKVGADRLHHALKDHESDTHEASGWGKRGKGYHNDANGFNAHEHGEKFHDSWVDNFHKAFDHESEKDYSKGHQAHKTYHNHDIVPKPPSSPHHHRHHHHHGYHDGWITPYEHDHGHELESWDHPEHDVRGKWSHDWGHGLD
ncbi:Constitutive coactivator of peroxisome proliferator-activated receptor gamma [Dirofilaria immitis]